ncbi:DUF4097 family beta strand repeat-containing protein [Actinoplanes flavus]|uniref:DUF4097 family beta strand repeat protein n=1 Tax=Actinoplanes flavus TaxID=2820290 RepID=A0ABS3UGK0_9ACTN|nr:DUF4097 family beta strand repeat-containing protein [Actinoplanes flavus]MBO3736817.1 DUF4097 family beta strand repeat protein [Actinoplanes flavus]
MQKYATTTAVTAVVNIPAGRIQVIAADRTDATVEVRPIDPGKTRDVEAAQNTTVAFTDGVLRVTGPADKNQLFGPSGTVEVTLQVPAGSRVEATTGAAEFRGVGRLGDVAATGLHGTVKIDEAGSLTVDALGADVTIGRLTGSAEINTQKGDITVVEATGGTVVLRAQMGDVTIGAAPGVSATLDAGTGYGRVHNTLLNSEGAAAALTIHATTSHGDITARSL